MVVNMNPLSLNKLHSRSIQYVIQQIHAFQQSQTCCSLLLWQTIIKL